MNKKSDSLMHKTSSLGVYSLWAIGVGLVISGESFGWNIGWGITGTKTFFIPVIIAACLYFSLVNNLIELTCVYPDSTGPQTFAELAFGKVFGNFISIALLVEFLFAIPAVANAISEYLGFLSGNHSFDLWIATIFLVIFSVINFFHISLKIRFVVILTFLAIIELNIFSLSILSRFDLKNFNIGSHENNSINNIFQALPYAVWMFLAIEGLALFTKYVESDNFREVINSGYTYSILTLFVFCGVVLVLASGSIVWDDEIWIFITSNNHPMPAILATVLGKKHFIVRVFTFLGLFGLIASLQGVISAAIIQFENIIENYGINILIGRFLAVFFVLFVGLVSVWSSTTGMLIEFSVFGAVSLYLGISLSLFKLRNSESNIFNIKAPELNCQHSSFSKATSNLYIFTSAIISLLCILAFAYAQPKSFAVFFILSSLYFIYYSSAKKLFVRSGEFE